MTQPLDLDQIEASAAAYKASHDHPGAFACCSAHAVADQTAAMAAEIRRLRARVTELEEERRLEWLAQGTTPHTPRLCACGHSHHAHRVPAPHSCFAHGQTCPCEAYQQLPHDEAVAQLKRNQQAAAERAAAEEAPVVADDSGNPGTRPCGHDDYHDPHEWADRPGVWCPGISYADDEPAAARP